MIRELRTLGYRVETAPGSIDQSGVIAYRIVSQQRSRYTHYYLYIRDEVLGPFVMCVGSFLPFQTTYYLNGHHLIATELQRRGVRVRTDDNAFLGTANLAVLQTIADQLDRETIRQRLDYWTLVFGPKFSKTERATIHLRRAYSLNQVEYCRNFIFRRSFPIHQIFERSAELRVFRLTADVITQIFGVRKHKRLRGKLHTMLEKLDHGHHVLRLYCKSLVARTYEKFGAFLRVEVCVNRLKNLGLNKGLEQLPALRQKLMAATDRLDGVEASSSTSTSTFRCSRSSPSRSPAGPSGSLAFDPGHTDAPPHGGAPPRRLPARGLAHLPSSTPPCSRRLGSPPLPTRSRRSATTSASCGHTASSSARVAAMPIDSPHTASKSPQCSSCSTTESAALSSTRSFITRRRPFGRQPRRSSRRTTRPTPRFNISSIWSQHKKIRERNSQIRSARG
jgi:hypothetical protein